MYLDPSAPRRSIRVENAPDFCPYSTFRQQLTLQEPDSSLILQS